MGNILNNIKNARETAKKASETLYNDTCVISIYENYTKKNKATAQRLVRYITDQPCKIVNKTLSPTEQTDAENRINRILQLHISPDIDIHPGSKITVKQIVNSKEIITDYEQSGKAAVYETHQEIPLKLHGKA